MATEAAWLYGKRGNEEERKKERRDARKDLTLTGLLMEGLNQTDYCPARSAKAILDFILVFTPVERNSRVLRKYLLIFILPLLASVQDTPSAQQTIVSTQIQRRSETFSNGRPKARYSFYRQRDGVEVLHGKYITWTEKGRKFSEQTFRNGEAEGRAVYWQGNGKKSAEGMYHDGRPAGTWVSWHANGQKKSSCNYVNGEKEGICLWWDNHGRLADSVAYIHGKPSAIAEWEARDQRAVKTPVYLYPSILVDPDGDLVFTSEYAGINKKFSLSQLEEVFASLPGSVWVDGKSIGITRVGVASEADQRTMSQITEKVKAFFTKKGYRVYGLPI